MAWGEEYHWITKPPLGSQLDLSHPLATSLIRCWLFNENAGTGVFDLINRSVGTLNSSATWKQGSFGGAINFASTGKVTFPSFTTASNWSWASWVNWTSGSGYQMIFGSDSGTSQGLYINTSKLDFYHGGDHFSNTALSTNKWYLLGLSNDTTNNATTFYINGKLDRTEVSAQGSVLVTELGNNVNSQQFLGLIGTTFVWNKTLSDAAHLSLYEDPFGLIQAPNHLRWRFPAAAVDAPVLLAPSQVSYFLPLAEVYQPLKVLPNVAAGPCPSIVQSLPLQTASAVTTLQSAAFGSSPASGNSIVVSIAIHSSTSGIPPVSSVTDTAGNTYAADVSVGGTRNRAAIYRAANITGGASFKVTVNSGAITSDFAFTAYEVANIGALDKTTTNGDDVGTNNPTSSPLTTTAAKELIVTSLALPGSVSQTITTPAALTSKAKQQGNSGSDFDAAVVNVTSIQSAVVYSWTLANSAANYVVLASYTCGLATPPGLDHPLRQRFDAQRFDMPPLQEITTPRVGLPVSVAAAPPSPLRSPSQLFDMPPPPEIRWPLLETRKDPFLPAKPPMQNPSQLFNPLPPIFTFTPSPTKDAFLAAKPPMAVPSQRWDPPVYVLVQQPGQPFATPIVIPPSPKLKAPDQRWDLPLWPCVVQPSLIFAAPGVNVPVVALQTVNGVFLIRLKGLPPDTLACLRRNAPDRDICSYHPGYTVPAVDTALPLGASANVALAYLNNLDTINDVVVKDKVGGTVLATVKPLRAMFVRLDALSLIGTPLAVSGVGSPVLEYSLWAPA